VLSELGVPSELGADSAWTFEPHGPEVGRRALVEAGWDGHAPVMAVCPIHPFWWPVKPSIGKFVAHGLFGAYKPSHYRTLYFHTSGVKVDAAFEHYISSMARAVSAFRERHGVFVILCAMEELDERACRSVAAQMERGSGGTTPIFGSAEYDMYQMVSILRACDWMVSSRYHGMVTSMPALVPAAGVTMDERIRNLLHEQGRADLLMTVEDPELEAKLLVAMETLRSDADAIRDAIGRTVVDNLKRMSRMGVFIEQNVHERYPDFPIRQGVHSWEEYLPPLSPVLGQLVEKYDSQAQALAAS